MNQLSTKRMKPNESPLELLDRRCISGWGDSETEASEILSDGAASSAESTAGGVESSHTEPEDYEMVDGSDGGDLWIEGPEGTGRFFMRRVESEDFEMVEEDVDPNDAWWVPGPSGPGCFLMKLEYNILSLLRGFCLVSEESLPNNSGWILEDSQQLLLELALEFDN